MWLLIEGIAPKPYWFEYRLERMNGLGVNYLKEMFRRHGGRVAAIARRRMPVANTDLDYDGCR